jgi:hypothetical protein
MRSIGRYTSVAVVSLVFLLMATGTPQSQSIFEDRVFMSHGGLDLVSRVDPVTNQYIGTATVGAQLIDMFPHTAKVNPTWIVACSPTAGLFRLSTNQGLVDKVVNTIGTVKSAFYVNEPPLQPHYVCGEDYSGTTSSAAIEFMDIDASKVSETLVNGSFGDRYTDVCFTRTDVGNDGVPNNDYFRWWFTNLEPMGSVADSLWVLDFNYSDTLQGDPNDPFNTNPIIPGPPFPKILTQLDANPGKYYQVTGLPSNEDTRMQCVPWKQGLTNWVVVCRSRLVSSIPLFIDNMLTLVNADFVPQTAPTQQVTTFGGGGAPPFKTMTVVGNYAIITQGIMPTSSGGTDVNFYYLPELANGTADGDDGNRGTVSLAGCDGIAVDVDQLKIYVGSDESDNLVWMLPVLPVTVSGGIGMINSSGAAGTLPVSTSVIPITMLTATEQQMPSPPNRTYAGRAGVSFRIYTDPVLTFPGQGNGSSKSGKFRGCTAGSGASLVGLAVLVAMLAAGALFVKR